jgi:hypothetical protein
MVGRLVPGIIALMLALSGAEAYDLGQHQWRHRLLILVAPGGDDPLLAEQRRRIAQRRDAMLERDLLVFQILRDRGLAGERGLPAGMLTQLREQLDVTADDRLMILIGKDGGVKRRAPLSTDLAEIFSQIDAMPMRREEMRASERAGDPSAE